MSFAHPTSVTFTVTSTGLHSQVGTASPAQFVAVALHVGLRGDKGDKGDKGKTGDMHPDIPAAVVAAQDAAEDATSAAAVATTKAGEASAARDIAVAAQNAAVAAQAASEAARDEANTFLPENFVPRAGGVALAGPLEVPSGAIGNEVVPANEAQWSDAQTVNLAGTAVDITGIPEGVNEISLSFGFSISASIGVNIRLIDSLVRDSGYETNACRLVAGASSEVVTYADGFNLSAPASSYRGEISLRRGSGNVWSANGGAKAANTFVTLLNGGISLTSRLTGIRIVPAGSASFTAGSATLRWRY